MPFPNDTNEMLKKTPVSLLFSFTNDFHNDNSAHQRDIGFILLSEPGI